MHANRFPWRLFTHMLRLSIGLLMLFVAACGGAPAAPVGGASPTAAGGSAGATIDDNAEVTVWVDTTRLDGVKLYQTKHPDAKLKIVTVDRGQFPAKVLLFNNTNQGWPDVVFAEPNLVAQVADAAHHFPLDMNDYVSSDVKKNFAPGSLDPCTFDGKLYCLRNDLAQVVLWYNKKLMDQFGYKVPTTWEEYAALGDQVAKEHPGYVIGAFGDAQGMTAYFWGSRCPVHEVKENSKVLINLTDSKCARVASMVDKLVANGSIAKLGPFDPAFVKLATDNKILMLPAASWFGEYVFGGKPDSTYYKTAEGQLGIAMPLKWKDEDKAYTGAHGGAAWTVSNHTKNPKLAVDVALWMSSSDDYQGSAPTFPAYLPAADKWKVTVANNKVYAADPYPVMKDASGLIDTSWGNVRFDDFSAFETTVIAAVQKGETVASALPEFQKKLTALAEAQGYEVVNQ
jgi:ABC-type glycerol-3-phosphate transport system substrate-binding protein